MDKEHGHDKPVVVRYYGDSRRDAMLRRNVSSGKVSAHLLRGQKPDIPELPETKLPDKRIFMTTVSDGSTTI